MDSFGPSALLQCYRRGVFPMSDSRDDTQVFLMDPEDRGIIPLDGLHISRSLRKFMRQSEWTVHYNRDFPSVIRRCAESDAGRENTWISEGLEGLYLELHHHEYVYSVETYAGEALIGGLYGVSLGGAFFGESMFSRQTNASKMALVGLVNALNDNGYTLLDTQFLTPHLATLGGIEIPRQEYRRRLSEALQKQGQFPQGSVHAKSLI
jgi:leucyl/phenylalanyl-tRNA--protein transferase